METLSPKLLTLLTRAAELRAAGASWTTVAQEIRKIAETCRAWPRRFPETWRRLFRQALGERAAEGGVEAHIYLRKLIRHDNPHISLCAAQFLQRAWESQMTREDKAERPDPAQVAAEVAEFAKFVKGLTDDQLANHLAEFLARRPAAAAGAASGTPDPPGPPEPQ